jgi:hypothetical protein
MLNVIYQLLKVLYHVEFFKIDELRTLFSIVLVFWDNPCEYLGCGLHILPRL